MLFNSPRSLREGQTLTVSAFDADGTVILVDDDGDKYELSTPLVTLEQVDRSICPVTRDKHVPDFQAAKVTKTSDDAYLNVHCRDCGRSGSFRLSTSLTHEIDWFLVQPPSE